MALKKYVSGVWQDVETLKRNPGSAWQDCESAKRWNGGAWQNVWENYKYVFLIYGHVLGRGSEYLASGNNSASGWFEMNGANEYITYQFTIPEGALFDSFSFHLSLAGMIWDSDYGHATCNGFKIRWCTYHSGTWSEWADTPKLDNSKITTYEKDIVCSPTYFQYKNCSKIQMQIYYRLGMVSSTAKCWYTITNFSFNGQRTKLEAAHYIGS